MLFRKYISGFFTGALLTLGTASASSVDPELLDTGKALFQSGATPACAVCHTLKDAGTSGTIGPNLDEMNLTVDTVKRTLIEGVGVMPSFAGSLSDAEMEAVAQYVVHASGSD